MFTTLFKFTLSSILTLTIVGGVGYLAYKNIPDIFSLKAHETVTTAHPNNDMVIGAVKELNVLEVYSAPMTQSFDIDMDRGKQFFFFDNKVHQKYLVSAEVVFTSDFSKLGTATVDWDTKQVNLALPIVEHRKVTLQSALLANSNSGWNQNVAMTVDEQNTINANLKIQTDSVLDKLAATYQDKATTARDQAVSSILSKFGLTLKIIQK